MQSLLRRLLTDARGATAVEYGLIAAIICVGLLMSADFLGEESAALWAHIGSGVSTASR